MLRIVAEYMIPNTPIAVTIVLNLDVILSPRAATKVIQFLNQDRTETLKSSSNAIEEWTGITMPQNCLLVFPDRKKDGYTVLDKWSRWGKYDCGGP